MLFLHKLPACIGHGSSNKQGVKRPLRLDFVEKAAMPAVESSDDLRRQWTTFAGREVLNKTIGELVVVLGALLRSHRFHGTPEELLVSFGACFNQIDDQICA